MLEAQQPTDPGQLEWWNLWGRLQAAARDLDAAVARLQGQRAYALSRPNLRADYEAKIAEIETARGRIVWLRDAIRSVMSFFGVELSGLGFIPLIPIAAVAAGVAFVAKLAADSITLSKRIGEQQRLESQGVPPAEAAKIVAKTAGDSGGLFAGLSDVVLLIGIGLGAFLWFRSRS